MRPRRPSRLPAWVWYAAEDAGESPVDGKHDMMDSARIEALLVGKIAPLGPRKAPSAIAKRPADGPLTLGLVGFAADAQGDLRVHGGPEKAVHHYPFDHYAAWRETLGTHDLLGAAGAFGERMSRRSA